MQRRLGSKFLSILLISTATSTIALGAPPAAAQAQVKTFDIPAQSLQAALNEFSRQAEVMVIISPELAAGRRSTMVKGPLPVGEAIKQLLQSSGLRAVRDQSGGYLVVTPQQPVAAEPPSGALSDDNSDGAATSKSDIVVTGTRLRIPNAGSMVPITSVTGAELQQSGRVSVGDALNDLPQLRSSLTSQNSLTGLLGNRGLNALDLRGLGTTRTLVLVNGRREVAADIINKLPIVDINAIPTDLIERVDIVTGGKSTVYGSDAIAGVVNFVLKDNYNGLMINARTGISTYGDAGNQHVSLLAGRNFADGRGNIAFNAEFAHQGRYYASGRPYRSYDEFIITETDPAGSANGSDGIFDRTFTRDLRYATNSLGGQVGVRFSNAAAPCGLDANPTRPAAYTCAYLFQPDGSLVQQTGTRVGIGPDGYFVGGNGNNFREGQLTALMPDLKRYAFNATGHFEVSRAFVPFFEARFVRTRSFGSSTGPVVSQGQTFNDATNVAGFVDNSYSNTVGNAFVNREGIRLDNPYLSTSARATLSSQLTAAVNSGVNPNTGVAYASTAAQNAALAQIAAGTFRFSNRRAFLDLGIRDEYLTRDTYKAVLGVRGDFNDDWHYEVSANYGKHSEVNNVAGDINVQRFLLAMDTTRDASGQIVCRSQVDPAYAAKRSGVTDTLSTPASQILAADVAACVPLNPFGAGNVSQAAKSYVTTETAAHGKATQFVLNGYVSGDSGQFLELPGGPVSFSVGGEYRRETLEYQLDPVAQAGYRLYNAIASFTSPAFEVKEAFGEISLPIVRDLPLLRELTLEASGRVANYRGSVGTVYAYSFGGDWQPVSDLRLRGAYSKSVRAPHLGSLYLARGQNQITVSDPCSARNLASGSTYRAANCTAAGAPAGYDYVYSGPLLFKTGGNPNLSAETSASMTLGGVYQPHYVPGLSLSLDYYDITVNNVISFVSAQNVLNLCYDSPTLQNSYCEAFQRAGVSGGPNGEQPFRVIEGSLLQAPFNFAKLKTRGIDLNLDYTHNFDFGRLSLKGIWTHLLQKDAFTNPTLPKFRNVLRGELGDPKDQFNIDASIRRGQFTVGGSFRWISGMYLGAWEDYNALPNQPPSGQPAQNTDYAPIRKYSAISYIDARVAFDPNSNYSLTLGVNNLANTLPPYGLYGSGADAIYDNRGRFFYAAVRVNFR